MALDGGMQMVGGGKEGVLGGSEMEAECMVECGDGTEREGRPEYIRWKVPISGGDGGNGGGGIGKVVVRWEKVRRCNGGGMGNYVQRGGKILQSYNGEEEEGYR